MIGLNFYGSGGCAVCVLLAAVDLDLDGTGGAVEIGPDLVQEETGGAVVVEAVPVVAPVV